MRADKIGRLVESAINMSLLKNCSKQRKEQPMHNKNALAELAECLSNDAEYLYGNNDKASEDVSKAQRIVAELANVED